MKLPSKDFWVVTTMVLALAFILQQATMGNALRKLEDKISEIEEIAGQNFGWVYIELEK